MILAVLTFVFAAAVLSVSIGFGAQLEVYWLVALAISPLVLLSFWRKPTLKSSQNVFAVVLSLTYAAILLLASNNLVASLAFHSEQLSSLYYFLIFAAVSALCGYLLGSVSRQHYALFATGVFFAIAYCCIPQSSAVLCAVCFSLITVSASFILSAAIALNKRLVAACGAIDEKNVAPALLVRNSAFTVAAVALFVSLTTKYLNPGAIRICGIASNIVCAVLLFVLTFAYLRQPMDFVAEKKLEYLLQQRADVDSEAVKNQLRERLATFHNFSLAIMLKKVLNVFTRIKVVGLEKVSETATCFVANHYEIYGPYIAVLKFPMLFMPWTEQAMTDKNSIARQLRRGIDNLSGKFVVKSVRKKIPRIIATPLHKIVQFARPIAVYHSGAENFEKMFAESAAALNAGDSLMIFPEKPPEGQNYKIGGIDKLQTGFVETAITYKNLTGRELNFYPMYIDKKGKQIIIGDKVTYNYDAPLHEEKTRVADELYEKLDAIYRQCENNRKKR